MRTWGIGRASARGFTLLELLVALAILVLVTGVAPLAFDRMYPARQLDVQAQRLTSELRDLRARAQASGKTASLKVVTTSAGQSQVALGEVVSDLPDGTAVKLQAGEDEGSRLLEQVSFYPDGSTSGGALTLSAGERRWRMSIGIAGQIRTERP